MNRTIVLATAAAVGALSVAPAASAAGLYGSLFGGTNSVSPMTLNATVFPYDVYPRVLHFDRGFALGGAIGTPFGAFRTEGELSYRSNGLRTVQMLNTRKSPPGDVSAENAGMFSGSTRKGSVRSKSRSE